MNAGDFTKRQFADVLAMYRGVFGPKAGSGTWEAFQRQLAEKHFVAYRTGSTDSWTTQFVIGRTADGKMTFGIIINPTRLAEKQAALLEQKRSAFEGALQAYFAPARRA